MKDLIIGTNSAVKVFATWVPLPSGEGDGSVADISVPLEGESSETGL